MMKRLLSVICAVVLLFSGNALSGDDDVRIVFFGDESEDAALIYNSEICMLIDAGLSDTGSEIADYMINNGMDEIDIVILSHYDKDHIGGMKKLIKEISVGLVYAPSYEKDSEAYEKLQKAIGKNELELTILTENTVVTLEPLDIEIQPADREYAQENDMSLITYITHGNVTMLFPGDIEKDRIQHELLTGVRKCDFIKIPHHGGIEDNTYEYLEVCGAQMAVITCSDEEPEDDTTTLCLNMLNIDYRLTRNGKVSLICDGENLRFDE